MSIYTVNYREAFLSKPNLTRILGIPTYNASYQIQLELKINAPSVNSNLKCGTHGDLGLLMTNTKYATLSSITYVRPAHPGILLIPNNDTQTRTSLLSNS